MRNMDGREEMRPDKRKIAEYTYMDGYPAIKKKRKGMASGGMLIGKKDQGKENELGIKKEEGVVVSKIEGKEKEKECTIISIYNSSIWGRLEEILNEQLEERREEVIIGRNFNIRIGEEGGLQKVGERRRKSKDKVVENGSRRFTEWINKKGGYIMNETTGEDKEREYTYVGA